MVSSLPRQREEVSQEDLRIMHEATGPRLTFRTGKDSELRAGKLCTACASEELSVPLKKTKTVQSDRVNLGGNICTIVFYCSFYHAMNTAV